MEGSLGDELEKKIKLNPLSASDLNDFEEFEKRVDEANALIAKILSGQADDVLNNVENLNAAANAKIKQDEREIAETSASLTKRSNKNKSSMINKTSINNSEPKQKSPELTELNSDSMSQDAFMKIVEADANKRHKDRMERNKKADHLMIEGNEAFRGGRYEKALCFYNLAVDVRRDSSLLFVNRALTYLRLGLYTKACSDCETALKLKESLKPRLYKGRALFEMAEERKALDWMSEAKQLYPDRVTTIQEYMADWQKNK